MSKSSHSFSVDIAAQEGLIEAILLQHVHFLQTSFVEKDQKPEDVWIKRSVKAYRLTYPYLTAKQIAGAFSRMEERDLMRSNIDNKVSYDRTKSVQVTRKGWLYFEENAFDEKANGNNEKANGIEQKGKSFIGNYSSFVDSVLEGERTPPAPNPSNLKEEKRDSGLVAPGEPLKLSKEQIEYLQSEAKKEKAPSPLNLGFCGSCMGLGYRNGRNRRETCEDCEGSGHGTEMISADELKNVDAYYDKKFPIDPRQKQTLDFEDAKNAEHQKVERSGIDQSRNPLKDFLAEDCPACDGRGNDANGLHCWECSGTGEANPNNTQFEVTAIASPTDIPGVTLVEAANNYPKLSESDIERAKEIDPKTRKELIQGGWEKPEPLKRANTILDAEKKILDWATGDGLATIVMRHGMSKRHVPEDLAPLVAHYVSVYASTNEGSRASLLRDPVAHFEAGLYKYLTFQNTIDRNNAPGNQAQVRNGTQGQKANINNLGSNPERYAETPLF